MAAVQMTDKPIVFSGPMVRALLAGAKTQTRRVFRPRRIEFFTHPVSGAERYREIDRYGNDCGGGQMDEVWWRNYVRFAAGDRLWVKETWQAGSTDNGPAVAYRANYDRWHPEFTGQNEGAGPSFDYDAHPTAAWEKGFWLSDVEAQGPWASPLHMPRWASRITLHVTEVRVQRLQDISEEDASAEGVQGIYGEPFYPESMMTDRRRFELLWRHLHGEDAWMQNHWVVAVTFDVERCNIAHARGGNGAEIIGYEFTPIGRFAK